MSCFLGYNLFFILLACFFGDRAQLLLSKRCVFFFSARSHSFHANPGLTGQMRCPSIELLKCWTDCISIYDLNAGSLPGLRNLDTTNFIIHQDQTGVNLCAHKASFGIHLLPHLPPDAHTHCRHISVITEYIRKIRRLSMILGESGPAVCAPSVLWSLHNHQSAFA